MALSKSGKAGSKVTQLDAARKNRSVGDTPKKVSRPASNRKQSTNAVGKSAAKRETRPVKGRRTSKGSDEGTEKDKTATLAASTDNEKVAARPRVGNRRFDTEKVERIKAAIAAGDYEINYLQVADKFIEHERYA